MHGRQGVSGSSSLGSVEISSNSKERNPIDISLGIIFYLVISNTFSLHVVFFNSCMRVIFLSLISLVPLTVGSVSSLPPKRPVPRSSGLLKPYCTKLLRRALISMD